MSIINDFKFINWSDFGEVVSLHKSNEPKISMRQYARDNNFSVNTRLPSAVRELLTLAKIYNFRYNKNASPVLFSYEILDAIFKTVIVSAEERDLILNAQDAYAPSHIVTQAEELISSLMNSKQINRRKYNK